MLLATNDIKHISNYYDEETVKNEVKSTQFTFFLFLDLYYLYT